LCVLLLYYLGTYIDLVWPNLGVWSRDCVQNLKKKKTVSNINLQCKILGKRKRHESLRNNYRSSTLIAVPVSRRYVYQYRVYTVSALAFFYFFFYLIFILPCTVNTVHLFKGLILRAKKFMTSIVRAYVPICAVQARAINRGQSLVWFT